MLLIFCRLVQAVQDGRRFRLFVVALWAYFQTCPPVSLVFLDQPVSNVRMDVPDSLQVERENNP